METKFREFYIDSEGESNITMNVCRGVMSYNFKNAIHVIEFAAVEQLKAENENLKLLLALGKDSNPHILSVLDNCDEQEAAKPKDIYTKIAEEGQISRDTVKLVEMAASICLNKDEFKRNPKDTPMFQVGDVVEWCGIRGVVESTSSMLSSVQCMFGYKDSTRKQTFTSDGKLCTWHIVPSLKLIERPKKKIKKYKVLYKRLEYENPFQVSGEHYANKADFEFKTSGNQFIQLIKESEIEVEE